MLTVQYSLYLTLEKCVKKAEKNEAFVYLLFESEQGDDRQRAVFLL